MVVGGRFMVVGGETTYTNFGRACADVTLFVKMIKMEHTNDRERNAHLDSENGPQ